METIWKLIRRNLEKPFSIFCVAFWVEVICYEEKKKKRFFQLLNNKLFAFWEEEAMNSEAIFQEKDKWVTFWGNKAIFLAFLFGVKPDLNQW